MMPAYRSMDSYPYQRNQIPFPHYYHPGIEPIHPQMKLDPSKPPFSYDQHWPYAGSLGHPIPPHSCCGHNNFPCHFSYIPSHPHAPSPMYYSGTCPSYSEPYFVPYSPQPHYTMDLPRYEYDKFMPREHHCCGCPNHPCSQKEGRSVKIEEHEPDGGKKVNDALAPIQLKNYPYPLVWIPQEFTSNKQLKNPNTMEVGEQDKPPRCENSNADAHPAQEPRVWNGWLPFNIKGAPNVIHDGYGTSNQKEESGNNRRESEDGKVDQKHQSEQNRSEFPFPIIWLPYYNKPEESGETNNQVKNTFSPKVIEEVPHTFKSVPVKSHVDDGGRNRNGTGSNQAEYTNTNAADVIEKGTNARSIPVKQMEENVTVDQKHQSEQNRSEFPFPIFWLPYYNKPEESGETKNQEKNVFSPKFIEEVPHTFKSVPVKSHVDEGGMNRNGTGSNQAEYTNTNAADVVEKVTNARSIPVKQMEENVTKKDSCTGDKKRQSASSPKGSKLPPVCLRVDPLPRKKNGNGSLSLKSRSPSPPSSKGQSRATTGETFKTPVSGTHDKGQPNSDHQNAPTNTGERVKPKEKTILVSEIFKTNENQGVDCRDGCQSQINVNIPSEDPKGTRETCPDGNNFKTEDKKEEKGAEKMREKTAELRDVKDSSAQTEAGQKKGRVLSDADAAVLIQSVYRGHQVRKWEPLKKLKQIDEVRKELTDVRGRVQAFERSSDLQNVDKQKIAIGETIMRLLLKLDTIQGLHPSFREIRKFLARELTILQERLDYIMAKKSQQQVQDFNVQEHVEVTPMNMQNEEQVAVPVDSAEGISDDAKGPCANVGGSESQSPVDPTSDKGAESVVLQNGSDNDDTCQVVTDDTWNSTSDLSEKDKMAVEPEAKSEVKDIPTAEDILNKVDKLYKTALEELPVGVVDEDISDVIIEKEEQDDVSSGSLQAMVDDTARDGLENHPMMELAVGLFDEDETDNEMNISKEGTQIKDGEFNADEKISSSTDNTAKETELEQQKKLEEQEEVHSSGQSDDREKIEYQEEGELNGDAPMEIRTECKLGEEVENYTELPPFTTQVNDHGPGNEDVCWKANDVNDVNNILPVAEPMEFVPSNNTQKGEEPEEKISVRETQEMVTEQVIGADDKDTEASSQEKMEFVPSNNTQKGEEPEEKISHRETQEMVTEQVIGADDKDTEAASQEKTELSEAPSALPELELPAVEHDVELNGGMKLQEENEKLREMMKKLLEAGNEQLSVISNLTGRVKDLEKKLARSRSKRLKTKRYRPATSKMSCMK